MLLVKLTLEPFIFGFLNGIPNVTNEFILEYPSKFTGLVNCMPPVSYTHLRAHETVLDLVCRLLLEKKKTTKTTNSMLLSLIQHI